MGPLLNMFYGPYCCYSKPTGNWRDLDCRFIVAILLNLFQIESDEHHNLMYKSFPRFEISNSPIWNVYFKYSHIQPYFKRISWYCISNPISRYCTLRCSSLLSLYSSPRLIHPFSPHHRQQRSPSLLLVPLFIESLVSNA